jgi:hypothetical protein
MKADEKKDYQGFENIYSLQMKSSVSTTRYDKRMMFAVEDGGGDATFDLLS